MGRSFSSIHFSDIEQTELEDYLKQKINKKSSEDDLFSFLKSVAPNDSVVDLLDLIIDSKKTYYLLKQKNCLSLYSHNFNYENILKFAKKYSVQFKNSYVLAVAMNDEDIFSIHLLSKGKIVSSIVSRSTDGGGCLSTSTTTSKFALFFKKRIDVLESNYTEYRDLFDLINAIETESGISISYDCDDAEQMKFEPI